MSQLLLTPVKTQATSFSIFSRKASFLIMAFRFFEHSKQYYKKHPMHVYLSTYFHAQIYIDRNEGIS